MKLRGATGFLAGLLMVCAPAGALDMLLCAGSQGVPALERALPAQVTVARRAEKLQILRADVPEGQLPALEVLKRRGLLAWAEPNHEVVAMDLQGDAVIWFYPVGTETLSDSAVQEQDAFIQVDIAGLQSAADGTGIVVGVVDSGVDYDHPDEVFTDRLRSGKDFVNNDMDAQDDNGHGTRVAGVIAAILDDVTILPAKALGSGGTGTVSDVVEAIEWLADEGADIVNLSLGTSYDSQALRDAVSYAQSAGAIVAASAGNENTENPRYPAAISSVIAVAGVDGSDVRADFGEPNDGWASNYGTYVDVSAPAIDIITTSWPDDFVAVDGTSPATAIVSAILAAEKELSKSNSEAEADLEATAVDIDNLNPGYQGKLGAGRVDAGEAVL